MVIAHYIIVENIDYDKWVHNETSFLRFLLVWHVIFMNLKAVEETRRKKNDVHLHMIVAIVGFCATYTLLHILLTPFLSYFDYESTRIEIEYFTTRYILMFLYIAFNVFINVLPLVNNFMFFLSDGIILS